MSTLYQADFYLWTQRQAHLLRTKDVDQLDVKHLVDEMLAMADQERSELKRRLEKLMRYLLRCKLQPERVSRKWLSTIYKQRSRIRDSLDDMPSMRLLLDAYLEEAYTRAAQRASDDARLPRPFFPATLPFTKQQLMDDDYIP